MDSLYSISQYAFMDEPTAMRALLAQVENLAPLEPVIMQRAVGWTRQIREQGIGHGVEAFLHAYGLNTEEGVALMCLAEALLRIPDAHTADKLIRDTFEGRNWQDYAGAADSWLVNLSSWGLLLTGKVIDYGQEGKAGLRRTLKNMVARTGEPVIREALKKAMGLIGGQFVLGETVREALKQSKQCLARGYRFSYDILGEGARSDAQAHTYVTSYKEGIARIGKTVIPGTPLFAAPGISVKLSALHPRYQLTQRERVLQELLPRLIDILLCAKQAGIAVSIDAEEATRLDLELVLFEQLLTDTAFAGWNGIGFVLQAYQKRAFYVVDWLAGLAQRHQRIIPLRLVKGAYWDSEIKWAQQQGLPGYPVFTRKEYTDVSYLACADQILNHRQRFYPQFATHNARTVASIMTLAERGGWGAGSYEFQRLHGMGEALHDLIIKDVPSRIYAPVGAHRDLLAYLIRRLLENGANSSFVHLLMDDSKSAEDILADPVAATLANPELMNAAIPLPGSLYGNRKNSAGMDFGNVAQVQALEKDIPPPIGGRLGGGRHTDNPIMLRPLPDPPPTGEGEEISLAQLQTLIANAHHAFSSWAATSVTERATLLERAADLLEAHRAELVALCADEGGKTLTDGIAELREAADFCRYYAQQARGLFTPQALTGPAGESNVLSLHPRGVFACISPWNFPLAIFIGQVAAALATGNCVIAKPAEQTPRIARRAVALLHEAGFPPHVVQLAPGTGETIGNALITDPLVSGVVFTGGTDTAKHINQALAARPGPIIPLIAETGGQNCMVVDSSALPEQAVDDIILSAFGSAGQRCSALRVLFVQEDIADTLLELLSGAMQELRLGDPRDPATDIGPVIDAQAQQVLLAHIEEMKKTAKPVAVSPSPTLPPEGGGSSIALPLQGGGLGGGAYFVPPHAFEISHISQLRQEHFGPILHIIRFKSGTLPQVIEQINATGYGLTFGIHSRIEAHVALLSTQVRAGNIYVNRSMTGAVVGVQPFGGEGLSGTGPKAGGPHYLMRFVTERVTTVNTAAIGGNVTLLAT